MNSTDLSRNRLFWCPPEADQCLWRILAYEWLVLVHGLTLSSKESVAFKAPSGRPKGKQYLQRDKQKTPTY